MLKSLSTLADGDVGAPTSHAPSPNPRPASKFSQNILQTTRSLPGFHPMNSGKRGIIIKWFDEKGYGFIEPVGGGPHLFFHVRSIRNSERRDLLGHRVTYLEGTDRDGRPAATNITLAVEDDTPLHRHRTPARPRRRRLRAGALVAWAIALGYLGAVSYAVILGYLSPLLLCAYAAMSLVTYFVYASDKARAGTGQRRTPELTLHWLEILGGWPGALIAQWQIGHKNRKPSYQMVFWAIIAIHIAGATIAARETQRIIANDIIIENITRARPRDVYRPF